ncbi:plasmid mobilization relaxosome protein MobC [Dysgonomonas sp. ZJ709]|uniref:plasmid mobilization protein n=1 Tax=Dysgonomonas sp. ZJ709 TaxID=2709797 RepID=UPI0013EC6D99|nr:plasmid mobilization relaxosome protein MobC [Dysgonomonas sp. ZJ709]
MGKDKLEAEALRGRPKKDKDKLSKSINLKLAPEDYTIVQRKALKVGLTATQYAREMTLNGGVKSRFTLEELDLIRKLSGIANNLNQLAKRANQAGFYEIENEVIPMLNWIKTILNDR